MPARPSRPARRPWWRRLAAVCCAVWFAITTVDLPALHTCAMHGMMHDAVGRAGMAGLMSAGVTATPAAAPARGSHTQGSARERPHVGHGCSCMGACCGPAMLEPPAPAALVLAARQVEAPVAPGRPAHEYVAAWVDFVLPFSTAPPARGSA